MAKEKKAAPETMTEEAKQLRRDYYKRWRQHNKDKIRAAQRRYWERLAARAAAEIAAAGGDPAADQSGELPEDQTEATTGRTLTAQDGAEVIDLDNMTEERLKALAELRRMETEGATV